MYGAQNGVTVLIKLLIRSYYIMGKKNDACNGNGNGNGNDYEYDYEYEENCKLEKIFKKYKGQPVEVITESRMKYCGIVVEICNHGLDIIDCKGRTVHLENKHIEAVIEPRMKLNRLCARDDCQCECSDDDECDCNECF